MLIISKFLVISNLVKIFLDTISRNQTIALGGAIDCTSCIDFQLNNSIIKNTNAQEGGAISLT